jgi:hypothetical protein
MRARLATRDETRHVARGGARKAIVEWGVSHRTIELQRASDAQAQLVSALRQVYKRTLCTFHSSSRIRVSTCGAARICSAESREKSTRRATKRIEAWKQKTSSIRAYGSR